MTEQSRPVEQKIDNIVADVGEVKLTVASLNGKVDALTGLMGSKWENVEARFDYMEKTMDQQAKAVVERINFEVGRSDEAHKDIRDDITQLKVNEIDPIKSEVDTNTTFRNKALGIAAAVAAAIGGGAGIIAAAIKTAGN